jgi:hypothetical protein
MHSHMEMGLKPALITKNNFISPTNNRDSEEKLPKKVHFVRSHTPKP